MGEEDPLGKEIATHSSILAWEIRWTEKLSGPLSTGSWVGHDWACTRLHHTKCKQSSLCTFFSSVQSFSRVWLFATPWTAAHQASLSITNSRSLLRLMSIESVMPSNHLILCRPLLLPLSIFPSIRVFSNESVLYIRWPKYWSFSFSISPSNEYTGLPVYSLDFL